mmetsp:Transcript_10192/g.32226  ORF Transcript_10192/g.32226 Transcript_10192/m.32226 type:complete len:273 (-) Transcript_10192:52-870(-)
MLSRRVAFMIQGSCAAYATDPSTDDLTKPGPAPTGTWNSSPSNAAMRLDLPLPTGPTTATSSCPWELRRSRARSEGGRSLCHANPGQSNPPRLVAAPAAAAGASPSCSFGAATASNDASAAADRATNGSSGRSRYLWMRRTETMPLITPAEMSGTNCSGWRSRLSRARLVNTVVASISPLTLRAYTASAASATSTDTEPERHSLAAQYLRKAATWCSSRARTRDTSAATPSSHALYLTVRMAPTASLMMRRRASVCLCLACCARVCSEPKRH